ncbi:efflux RND transporter permease subunit [Vibrio maerlii]|uniref:efflux RND transporter permease subunit n=1 Tax=Vibrio maerlii TaxID=2231648 RepID=UPI000E3D2459|nr:efflux RND transporter permease subunit [Vibrio maerlii]
MKVQQLLRNSRTLALFTALLVVAGLSALQSLPRAEDPIITNRNAAIITSYQGATPERVEALVSEVIETELRTLDTINLITSSSRPGISVVNIELHDYITDSEPVWSRVRDKLNDVQAKLPSGTSTPSLDSDHSYAFTYITAVKWQGQGEPNLVVLNRYAKELAQQFRAMKGTEFVDEYGLVDEEILVQIDIAAASTLGSNALSLSDAIGGADAKNAAGELVNQDNRFALEVSKSLDTLERIRQVPVAVDQDGYVIRLEDIATTTRSMATPPAQIALVDGEPAIIVAARMNSDIRVDKWTPRAINLVERFSQQLPQNIVVDTLFEQNSYTQLRLSELMNSLLIGFGLVLIVLLLTLGVNSALIVALSLPLTAMLTLALMKATGLPINQMSVTGLIVALGIMVDNAIVMVDTIQNYRRQGMRRVEAALAAIQHLWTPLLGSTLTTVLAFAPIFLMPGPAGEFVGAIAITVSFSLLGSYLIAHTLVAGFAARFLPSSKVEEKWYQHGLQAPALASAFRKTISAAIHHPKKTVLLVCAIPLFGFWSAGQLTEQFFPPSDRDMFEIQLFMPPQASIYATQDAALEVENIIRDNPKVESINWLVGTNFPSFYYNMLSMQRGAPYFAQAMVKMEHFSDANAFIPELQETLDRLIPQAQVIVRKLEQGPPFNAPLEIRVVGHNLDTLSQIGEELRLIMAETPDVTHTRSTLQQGIPKIWLDVNEESTMLGGMNLSGLASTLEATLMGRVQGNIIEGVESIPVRVRIASEQKEQLSDLSQLPLSVNTGNGIEVLPLAAMTDFKITPTRGAIVRRDGQRVNTIEGFVAAGVLPQTALNAFKNRVDSYLTTLPHGYYVEFGGESAERDESVAHLLSNLSLVVTLMILVVVLSFNSFRLSTIIFLVAALAAGLGLLSVWVFSYPFGFTVIIGLLGVVGLAINAAIIILAELKSDEQACSGDKQAITHGVMSCTRHITSTTITTIGGFLPLILGGGGFWPPFAVAVAGGTLLTTLISFYVVPPLFVLMNRKKKNKVVGELRARELES